VIATSANSTGSQPVLLSSVIVTSAIPMRARRSLPEKIMSSVLCARSSEKACSPSAQRTASAMFDLPLPLGPTIDVIPPSKRNSAGSAKVLYPISSSLFSRMDYRVNRPRL
jgi:hypothetical protein